jgi:hypothetical protein
MIFKLNVNGPFEIVKTKSNTGAAHPLATPSKSKFSYKIMLPCVVVVGKKPETLFCLQPLKILEIEVKFKAPAPNSDEWPMIIRNERHGDLSAHFANG